MTEVVRLRRPIGVMETFSAELLDLLCDGALRSERGRALSRSPLRDQRARLAWLPVKLPPALVARSLALLDRALTPHLTRSRRRIPVSATAGMRKNYAEKLPKAVSNHSAIMVSQRSAASRAARELGLLELMRSDDLRRFAERISGFPLHAEGVSCQVICYEPGDYVGPHNDHHPEVSYLRDGYVDLHMSWCSPSVAHQWLVYERAGHLSEIVDIAVPAAVSISHLPFWHYTTPLVAKRGRESTARRWLCLSSFIIDRDRRT